MARTGLDGVGEVGHTLGAENGGGGECGWVMRDGRERVGRGRFWEGFAGTGAVVGGAVASKTSFAEGFAGYLAAAGGIDGLALQRAQRAARESGERLDHVLAKLGLIAEGELAARLAGYLAIPVMEAGEAPVSPVLAERVPERFVRGNRVVPLALTGDGRVLRVGFADPFAGEAFEALEYATGLDLEPRLLTASAFDGLVASLYGRGEDAGRGLVRDARGESASEGDLQRLREIANEAPVIRHVNQIIANAIDAGASDIHIEPGLDGMVVRTRVDGALATVEVLPPGLRAAIASRIKIMSRLDIAEQRMPQDGRTRIAVRGSEIDFRVSTLPTAHGESIVMRILDRARVPLKFDALGFEAGLIERFRRVMAEPNGIVLVTGPTGSGKTTTLYTALSEISRPDVKVVTVEDPIEYLLAGINQVQVHSGIGLDFPHALRSILRQDPDVIMIGEIRDAETARIAIQAALTGHLVFSTLHTNSAAASITRLIDMGVESYLIAATVKAVMAQRLVRRVCRACAVPMAGADAQRWEQVAGEGTYKAAVGCEKCRGTGYSGRSTIAELMVVDGDLRGLIAGKAGDATLEAAARAAGMRPLGQDGLAKARAGITTVNEVLSVAHIE